MTNLIQNSKLVFRQPLLSECELLSQLAMKSKQHWGYDDAFMASCCDELKVTPEKLQNPEYFYEVTESQRSILGFYCLEKINNETLEVEALFVTPDYIGVGLGAIIWEQLCANAKASGCKKLLIASDPNAECFYQRMGTVKVGEVASESIAGRCLPLMEYRL